MVFSKSVYGRAACWWLLLALGIDSAGAAEPFRTFLEALRNNGLHDSALQYLDQMAGSPWRRGNCGNRCYTRKA